MISITESQFYYTVVKTRIPFVFGRSVLRAMPVLYHQLTAEKDGKHFEGVSAFGIPPLWFDKSPEASHESNIRDIISAISFCRKFVLENKYNSIYKVHKAMDFAFKESSLSKLDGLILSAAMAFFDNALVDGFCRLENKSFFELLKLNAFGMENFPVEKLPDKPLSKIGYRHTVGISDAICAKDVLNPVGDGLPESLEEVLGFYGPRFLKIKINGQIKESIQRLLEIESLLGHKSADFKLSLDGNEQFKSMEEFYEFVILAKEEPGLAYFWNKLLWVEQPVYRACALEDSVKSWMEKISSGIPVIIDESDSSEDALVKARRLGYSGISAKNCKSVFRTLSSYRYICNNDLDFILSSEDLTNVPIVPLHQDLCVAAALGIEHSERNGHHYIRGSEFLSEKERRSLTAEYGNMYTLSSGLPVVHIEKGELDLEKINNCFFGVKNFPDFNFMNSLDMENPGISQMLLEMEKNI